MARITFKQGEVQELHGTFCGLIYTLRGGRQFVKAQKPATCIAGSIIQDCVKSIQSTMFSRTDKSVREMQRIADDYPAIKKACERMYKDFLPVFGAKFAKMQKAIVYWYCNKRLPPELDLFCDKLPDTYTNNGFCPTETRVSRD